MKCRRNPGALETGLGDAPPLKGGRATRFRGMFQERKCSIISTTPSRWGLDTKSGNLVRSLASDMRGDLGLALFASRAYLNRRGTPVLVADLADHDIIGGDADRRPSRVCRRSASISIGTSCDIAATTGLSPGNC